MQIDPSFEHLVQQLLTQYKGKRIHDFFYENQRFWLKQPEQLVGVWKLLKPAPQKAFQHEVEMLQHFQKLNAPVPKMVLCGKDFFVLEDAGRTAISWIDDKEKSVEFKQQVLLDCVEALIALHKRHLVHGRPAVRDMTWKESKVYFIDFESRHQSKTLQWKKVRDMLIFFHSLCRSRELSDEQIQWVMQQYQQRCDQQLWQIMLNTLQKYRWLNRFLLLFKSIARTDLMAIYRLFKNLAID